MSVMSITSSGKVYHTDSGCEQVQQYMQLYVRTEMDEALRNDL